jgi:hypothetical protein
MWQGSRDNKVDLDDVQRSAYEASVRWRAPMPPGQIVAPRRPGPVGSPATR